MSDESEIVSPHSEQTCSEVQAALNLLGRSRAGAVLAAVLAGSTRYGQIRHQCPGVSDAVLSARLRDLCQAGLIVRNIPDGGVEYRPTAVGLDVQPVLDSLTTLVQRHPQSFRDPSTRDTP